MSSIPRVRIKNGMARILARSSLGQIRNSMPGRHAPNAKKKTKQPVILKKKKDGGIPMIKLGIIEPPVDPEEHTNPHLLEPKRSREVEALSDEQKEQNALMEKEWARHKMNQHRGDLMRIQRLAKSRENALKELRKCSVFLHDEALKVDKTLFPVTFKGPTETPPITDYFAPEPDFRKT